jgi:hypothetical protein
MAEHHLACPSRRPDCPAGSHQDAELIFTLQGGRLVGWTCGLGARRDDEIGGV